MHQPAYRIRHATEADIDRIKSMQERSLRMLGGAFYPSATIESYLRLVGTLDNAVVGEGHYFVAVDRDGTIAGSGGWSQLRPRYATAGVAGPAVSVAGPPTVRSVFVDPDHARRGIGSSIMRRVEEDAAAAGIASLRLAATLSGISLYRALGYAPKSERAIVLADGTPFPLVDMEKTLGRACSSAPIEAA